MSGDWSADELAALEKGASMSVVGQLRSARETSRRRDVRAAGGKVSPESVNYGIALGLERCGLCRNYQPNPANAMSGTCEVVDLYRTERNDWCERYTMPAPSTAGAPGGTVARSTTELAAMFAGGLPRMSAAELITSNRALIGELRVLRGRVEQKYGSAAPKMVAGMMGRVF